MATEKEKKEEKGDGTGKMVVIGAAVLGIAWWLWGRHKPADGKDGADGRDGTNYPALPTLDDEILTTTTFIPQDEPEPEIVLPEQNDYQTLIRTINTTGQKYSSMLNTLACALDVANCYIHGLRVDEAIRRYKQCAIEFANILIGLSIPWNHCTSLRPGNVLFIEENGTTFLHLAKLLGQIDQQMYALERYFAANNVAYRKLPHGHAAIPRTLGNDGTGLSSFDDLKKSVNALVQSSVNDGKRRDAALRPATPSFNPLSAAQPGDVGTDPSVQWDDASKSRFYKIYAKTVAGNALIGLSVSSFTLFSGMRNTMISASQMGSRIFARLNVIRGSIV
jgi:hypothetical protein